MLIRGLLQRIDGFLFCAQAGSHLVSAPQSLVQNALTACRLGTVQEPQLGTVNDGSTTWFILPSTVHS
jgi:hypothetical protein